MAVLLAVGPWWTFVVRGVLAILFGVLTFLMPGITLLTLVILFGVYAIGEGIFNIAAALQRTPAQRTPARPQPRWVLLLAGVVSILAGLAAVLMPGITALSLLYLIAAWSIVRGVVEIVAAISLRKEIEGEWLFVLSGVLSVAFGLLLFTFPGAGALAVVLWIGAFAIVFGALLVALGVRLRSRTRTPRPGAGFQELASESR
jgi:uncharacterized membrane protein HdeD (DUF308 family)